MRIFKFGGASVKNADAVKNLASILQMFGDEKIVVVISAMGKTTNALEKVMEASYTKRNQLSELIEGIKKFHYDLLNDLFLDRNHSVFTELENTFIELDWATEDEPQMPYDQLYDQVVSVGEIVSTKIVSAYLKHIGIRNEWKDARDFIATDDTYREAKVNWDLTAIKIKEQIELEEHLIVITQGFIGSTAENYTTTLGREGSDYTASILAHCLNANDVTIWKDVPGVLNADPKYFDDTILLPQLTYQDAIELTYYGASVIHPKTIKPLQNKNIPLFVRSFLNPLLSGTQINADSSQNSTPCFIFKQNQILISISPKDFSFIVEENLRDLFAAFSKFGIKINMMQNSAISFSICADNKKDKITQLVQELKNEYRVLFNEDLDLITIRNYNQQTIEKISNGKDVILEQRSRSTIQLVTKKNVE